MTVAISSLAARSRISTLTSCARGAEAIPEVRVEGEQAALMWFSVADQGSDFLVVKQGICEGS